jgi:hypothetical protein
MNSRIVIAALAAVALAVPTAATAKSGHGNGHEKHSAKVHGKAKKPKKVMFIFKGTLAAPGSVQVVAGNSHVRKGGFVGQEVVFDFADAKVVAADTNADQKVDVADVSTGDVVLVQARVAKRTAFAEGADPIVARKLVDKTHPRVEDEPSDDDAAGE